MPRLFAGLTGWGRWSACSSSAVNLVNRHPGIFVAWGFPADPCLPSTCWQSSPSCDGQSITMRSSIPLPAVRRDLVRGCLRRVLGKPALPKTPPWKEAFSVNRSDYRLGRRSFVCSWIHSCWRRALDEERKIVLRCLKESNLIRSGCCRRNDNWQFAICRSRWAVNFG